MSECTAYDPYDGVWFRCQKAARWPSRVCADHERAIAECTPVPVMAWPIIRAKFNEMFPPVGQHE